MAMKGYFAFPKAQALLEPHHQIVKCYILKTRWWKGLTPLQKYSQYIQQFHSTGLYSVCYVKNLDL